MSAPIGFVGMGRMGGSIALRLIDSGHSLVVCDPNSAALAPFLERGVRRVPSPAAAADEAEIVFACLPSVEISRETALGRDGVIEGRSVRCYIECSTVGRPTIADIASRLAERGVEVIDAPVSGGPSAARAGTLSLIVSGSAGALERATAVLKTISSRLFVVGGRPGMAQVCKLVNNALSLVGMALACEAVLVGAKAGLNPRIMLDVINASTGRNSATLDKFPNAVLNRTFDYGGPLGAATKDLNLFLEEANRLAVPASVTEAGAALWEVATREGDPNRDFTTLICLLERWAGFEVDGRTRGESNV